MGTGARLAAYALTLAAVFGGALGVGAAVGPVGPAAADHGTAADGSVGCPADGHAGSAGDR